MCGISLLMLLFIFLFWLQAPQCFQAVIICGKLQSGSPVPKDHRLRWSRSHSWWRAVSLVLCEKLGMDRIWETLQESPHYMRGRNKDQSDPNTLNSHRPCSPVPKLPHLTHIAPTLPCIKAAINAAKKNRWRKCVCVCSCLLHQCSWLLL